MRIAVLADIHGNLPALEAVIADLERYGVDDVIINGDAINGAPFPLEVLDIIYQRNWRMVMGNHEEYMLACNEPDNKNYPRDLWKNFYWTHDRLRPEDFAFIRSLPTSIKIDNLIFMHGSPRRLNYSVLPSTPDNVITNLYGRVKQRYIITAHTHIPIICHWRDKVIINPGAVGMSFDGNPMPSYAVLTRHNDEWLVEHRRVLYNPEEVRGEALERGLLELDVFALNTMQQILTGKPRMRSLLNQIYAHRDQSNLSLKEAVDAVDIDLVQPDDDYTFANRRPWDARKFNRIGK
jgi:putative phosphoesterase